MERVLIMQSISFSQFHLNETCVDAHSTAALESTLKRLRTEQCSSCTDDLHSELHSNDSSISKMTRCLMLFERSLSPASPQRSTKQTHLAYRSFLQIEM